MGLTEPNMDQIQTPSRSERPLSGLSPTKTLSYNSYEADADYALTINSAQLDGSAHIFFHTQTSLCIKFLNLYLWIVYVHSKLI